HAEGLVVGSDGIENLCQIVVAWHRAVDVGQGIEICEFLSHRVDFPGRNLVAGESLTGCCIASWIANRRGRVIERPRPIREIARPFLGRRNLYRILRGGRVLSPAVIGEEPKGLVSSVVEARNPKWSAECTAKLVLFKWCHLRHRSVQVGMRILLQRTLGVERV